LRPCGILILAKLEEQELFAVLAVTSAGARQAGPGPTTTEINANQRLLELWVPLTTALPSTREWKFTSEY